MPWPQLEHVSLSHWATLVWPSLAGVSTDRPTYADTGIEWQEGLARRRRVFLLLAIATEYSLQLDFDQGKRGREKFLVVLQ